MANAAPQFYLTTIAGINLALYIVVLGLEVVALIHCLLQRADAFAAIGTFSKGVWLAILGGCVMFTLFGLAQLFGILAAMIAMIPVVVVLVYLLDVRPALRDAIEGRGSW